MAPMTRARAAAAAAAARATPCVAATDSNKVPHKSPSVSIPASKSRREPKSKSGVTRGADTRRKTVTSKSKAAKQKPRQRQASAAIKSIQSVKSVEKAKETQQTVSRKDQGTQTDDTCANANALVPRLCDRVSGLLLASRSIRGQPESTGQTGKKSGRRLEISAARSRYKPGRQRRIDLEEQRSARETSLQSEGEVDHSRRSSQPRRLKILEQQSTSSSSSDLRSRISPRVALLQSRIKEQKKHFCREIFGFAPVELDEMSPKRNRYSTHNTGEESMLLQQSKSGVRRKDVRTSQYADVLNLHNVEVNTVPVPSEGIAATICRQICNAAPYQPTERERHVFAADVRQCNSRNATEYEMQRTIVMAIFDRASELYGNILDWMCEATWHSPDPPTRDHSWLLSSPKPDVCVCFRDDEVLGQLERIGLGPLMNCMKPVTAAPRAFPFLFIEAKGSRSENAERTATYQNLNTASRALFNIWKFMEDPEHHWSFYEEVRVFSIIVTPTTLHLFMHWAVQLPQGHGARMSNDYPLAFRYCNLKCLEGAEFTSGKARGHTDAILEYAVKILLPILRDACNFQLRPEKNKERQEKMRRSNSILASSAEQAYQLLRSTGGAPNVTDLGTNNLKRLSQNNVDTSRNSRRRLEIDLLQEPTSDELNSRNDTQNTQPRPGLRQTLERAASIQNSTNVNDSEMTTKRNYDFSEAATPPPLRGSDQG